MIERKSIATRLLGQKFPNTTICGIFIVNLSIGEIMPESIHEQIGENTVRQMDMLAITLGISEENMPAFVAKRNVVAWVFAESNVPDDIHEMLANIRQGADSAPFAAYIQKPEFVLDAVMAGYALRARRTEP